MPDTEAVFSVNTAQYNLMVINGSILFLIYKLNYFTTNRTIRSLALDSKSKGILQIGVN